MDSELRKRIDIGLVLLAVIAGSTAVAGAGATDGATVAAGILAVVLVTAVGLFLIRTPSWARDEADS
jgi:Na+(H+)/acetate symporter ActP